MEVVNNDMYQTENSVNTLQLHDIDTEIVCNHSGLYKVKSLNNQQKRRKKLLEEVKHRRNKAVDEKRSCLKTFINIENEEPMDTTGHSHRIRKHNFRYSLMLSEWFTEIPDDLESNWLVKLCPKGKRNLVVAYEKITKAYNIQRKLQATFQSALPGGGPQTSNYKTLTVLDCIFNPVTLCYYVLDVVVWNSNSVKFCDTAFRFYWLNTKLSELPDIRLTSSINKYAFIELESFPAELSVIENKLYLPYTINGEYLGLDGVLFYHKEIDYIECITPLIGWLKPFMVPEMLQIAVHQDFMLNKPPNYLSVREYLNKSNSTRKRKSKKSKNAMDVTPVV